MLDLALALMILKHQLYTVVNTLKAQARGGRDAPALSSENWVYFKDNEKCTRMFYSFSQLAT